MSFDYIRDPEEITRRSFEEILNTADFSGIPDPLLAVAVRLVHACALPGIVTDLAWSENAAAKGEAALKAGAPVFCDARMVAEGVIRPRLPAENKIICTLNEPGIEAEAKKSETTRSAQAVNLWTDRLEGAIVAIGNAPTALFRLLEIIADGGGRPAVILGFPIGFIGAAESKEALIVEAENRGLDYITLRGRFGGSALAAASVNALARSATEMDTPRSATESEAEPTSTGGQ